MSIELAGVDVFTGEAEGVDGAGLGVMSEVHMSELTDGGGRNQGARSVGEGAVGEAVWVPVETVYFVRYECKVCTCCSSHVNKHLGKAGKLCDLNPLGLSMC